jgi:hypothetical protein
MARETKAERLAREAAEKLAQQAAQAATYPQRLMALLERAQNVNFELTVKDGEFLIKDIDKPYPMFLSISPGNDNEAVMRDLETCVEVKEDQLAEAQRRVMVRNQALNKLSLEEREILGLM